MSEASPFPQPLDEYRAKRDFGATPEPAGDEPTARAAGETQTEGDAPRFVVQEHHARRLHWDLRFEHDGVLASWAVPKGIPPDPKVNHLAVHTEDHPLLYLEFEGEIPKGQYGAGTMTVWDRGTYERLKWSADEVMVVFHGEKVRGRYVLFRTGGDQWMLHRMDPPADPDRQPFPDHLAPMLATPGDLPDDDAGHAYEVAWDGVRVLAFAEGGRVRLPGDGLDDLSPRYPELRALGPALGAIQVVLDGEVIVPGEGGRPDRERLATRRAADSDAAARRAAEQAPVAFMIYDLLYLDGHLILDLPYTERRRRLDRLGLKGPSWQVPAYHVGDGAALLSLARQQGLAGVVAKGLDSPYRPGAPTSDWIEISA